MTGARIVEEAACARRPQRVCGMGSERRLFRRHRHRLIARLGDGVDNGRKLWRFSDAFDAVHRAAGVERKRQRREGNRSFERLLWSLWVSG